MNELLVISFRTADLDHRLAAFPWLHNKYIIRPGYQCAISARPSLWVVWCHVIVPKRVELVKLCATLIDNSKMIKQVTHSTPSLSLLLLKHNLSEFLQTEECTASNLTLVCISICVTLPLFLPPHSYLLLFILSLSLSLSDPPSLPPSFCCFSDHGTVVCWQ